MNTIDQMHQENKILESNIRFYSMEINFLLKILTHEYGIMASTQKTEVLDAFWKEFEIYGKRLKVISAKISQQENDISQEYKGNFINLEDKVSFERELIIECDKIIEELKTLKASLYDFLENSHVHQ